MAGLTNAVVFVKRMKKLNTDQVYRQRKYNLLHEESEGYSKVSAGVNLVCAAPPPPPNH